MLFRSTPRQLEVAIGIAIVATGVVGLWLVTIGGPGLLAVGVLAVLAALLLALWAGIAAGLITMGPTLVADIAGYGLLGITAAFFGWLYLFSSGWTPRERQQLYLIGLLFLGAALFWSEFEQAGSTLNLFADRNTRNEMFGVPFPSSWFQAANALFIIVFAPVFAWLWVRLARRGLEPTSTGKFGLGLVLVGAGFATLVIPAMLAAPGTLVSPWWLIVTYLLHTWGELALSPVGLSAMSKLAPARIGGLIMGVWFLAASVGNYFGGRMAAFYESMPLSALFGLVAATGVGAGLVMLAIARVTASLERSPHGA